LHRCLPKRRTDFYQAVLHSHGEARAKCTLLLLLSILDFLADIMPQNARHG
jgi:hypothetical protein